jgi:hypothetical protein
MTLPAVPDTFRWLRASWGAALECVPLAAIAPHVFTTRELPLSSSDDWLHAAAAVGATKVQTLTQVHGAAVYVARDVSVDRPEADAVVTDRPDLAVAVRVADCVPILIADPVTGTVAAVHAGWRGTAAGVAGAAVAALKREFGARPGDLVAALGPSIGPCCYEVGTELVDAFAAAGHARHLADRWFEAPPPPRGARPALAAAPKLRLDTWLANRDQLLLAGLAHANVHTCGICTASNLTLFPSYRMEGKGAGRIGGLITTKGKR